MKFFQREAGGIVGRTAETALQLARAEREAARRGWTVAWEEDSDADWSWLDQPGFEREKAQDHEVYAATLKDKKGKVLAALGDIFDPSDNYRRVVEAELASEALAEWNPGRGARFTHQRVRRPGRFIRRSFRTVKTPGGARVVLGHLKGERRRTKSGRRKLTAQAVLRPKGKRVTVRKNPAVAILGNPPPAGAVHLGKATDLEYVHVEDGKLYHHPFTPKANVTLLPDGRIVLWHPQHKLWEMFETT